MISCFVPLGLVIDCCDISCLEVALEGARELQCLVDSPCLFRGDHGLLMEVVDCAFWWIEGCSDIGKLSYL